MRGDIKHEVTCNYCGRTSLMWGRYDGRWVLVDATGKQHTCLKDAAVRASMRSHKPSTWRRGKSPGSYGGKRNT